MHAQERAVYRQQKETIKNNDIIGEILADNIITARWLPISHGLTIIAKIVQDRPRIEYLGISELISEIVVVGRKGTEPGEIVITALVYPDYDKFEGKTKEEIQAAIEEVVDGVNKKLPTFKHIKQVEIRETEFEKNTSRKIMRYKIQ